jgi:hypothetical protein
MDPAIINATRASSERGPGARHFHKQFLTILLLAEASQLISELFATC